MQNKHFTSNFFRYLKVKQFSDKDAFQESAKKLGFLLANSNIKLVYGGGNEGLMGTLASSYLQTSNKVKGVIPHFLKDILKSENLVSHVFVEDLAERKKVIFSKADHFIKTKTTK